MDEGLFGCQPLGIACLAADATQMGGDRVFVKMFPAGQPRAVLVEVRSDGTVTAGAGWEPVIENGILTGVREGTAVG